MKKFFSILAVSSVIFLAACNSSTESTETTDSTATTEAVDSVKAPVTVDSTAMAPADTTKK